MTDLGRRLRVLLRSLFRHPGYPLVVIGTLALAIGANTAIFSVAHGVLVDPLPYPDSERLVLVRASFSGTEPTASIAGPMLAEFRRRATTIDRFEALWTSTAALEGGGDPEKVRLGWITPGFLPLLGGEPEAGGRGRLFADEEALPGAPPVALLSHELWTRRYGADPEILGKTVRVDGGDWMVVGVVPEGFRVEIPGRTTTAPPDLWVPLEAMMGRRLEDQNRESLYLRVLGRRSPDASLAESAEEMHAIGRHLRESVEEYAGTELDFHVAPLREDLVADTRAGLVALLGAVAFVLLIACANAGNLALARTIRRQGEMAVRSALGASRGRLIGSAILENLVVGLAGGALGLLLAWWALDLLVALRPAGLPRLENVALDAPVLAFNLGASLFGGLLITAITAWRILPRRVLRDSLKSSSGVLGGSRGHLSLRRILVGCEVALSIVLLVGAGLMMQSFLRLQGSDPGFEAGPVLTFKVSPPGSRYAYGTPDEERPDVREFHNHVKERLEGLPGVRAVGAISHLPLDGRDYTAEYWRNPDSEGRQARSNVQERSVVPGYFEAMGIPVLRGRVFDGTETRDSDAVVVDRTLAAEMWPEADPIGQRLRLSLGTEEQWRTVVGVVEHVRHDELTRNSGAQLYVPFASWTFGEMVIVVRAEGAPESLVGPVRAEMGRLDPALPVYDLRPMRRIVRDASSGLRYPLLLMGAFAAIALLLAVVGIYGTLSYLVGLRTREIGLRLAIGARARDIRQLVAGQALRPVVAGVAAGLLGALLLTRLLESLLYGVTATDPATFVAIAVAVPVVAALACWIPAERATRVHPTIVLRE